MGMVNTIDATSYGVFKKISTPFRPHEWIVFLPRYFQVEPRDDYFLIINWGRENGLHLEPLYSVLCEAVPRTNMAFEIDFERYEDALACWLVFG